MKRLLASMIATALLATDAAAQSPQLTLTQEVAIPGAAIAATVTGPPGAHFAILGSTVGAGFTYGGVALAVGPDVTVLAVGALDGAGVAIRTFAPPFVGTTLDRYYVQAAVSASANFVPLQASPGRIVKNADVVADVAGPPGPVGPIGPTGLTGQTGGTGPAGPQGPPGSTTGLPSGTSTAPSINFANDPATGIFSPGVGEIGMTVSDSGRPGVLFLHNLGPFNTAVGAYALHGSLGDQNSAFGHSALSVNFDGRTNVAVGVAALRENTSGSFNTAIGAYALMMNFDGPRNVAVGVRTLSAARAGADNVAVGGEALRDATYSYSNIAIGAGAGSQMTNGMNNIYIGNSGEPIDAGRIRIGTAGRHLATYVHGIAGTGLTSGAIVLVGPDGQLGNGPGTVPASANAPCIVGTMAWDSNFIYLCVAQDTWRRTPLASW